jgi:hypothetical protein
MTTDDELLRQVTTYLDECEGTTLLPDSIREAVMADFQKTPQSRPTGLARFLQMSTSLKLSMAAAVVAVAVLIGITFLNGRNVGPSPDITATPSASPTVQAGVPDELAFAFLGPAKGIEGVGSGDRGDLDMTQSMLRFVVGDGIAFTSAVGVTSDGQLQLQSAVNDLCADGDVGTYPYALSPGGTVLTVEEGVDDCAVRAAAMPGQYLRANCRNTDNWCLGNVEPGSYASHYFEPRPDGQWRARHGALTYSVPEGWAAYSDWPDVYGLTPTDEYEASPVGPDCYDCAGDRDTVTVLAHPGAATEDCLEDGNVPGVGLGAQDLADWLVGHRGLIASPPESRTIGGNTAISLMIEGRSDWTGTCDEAEPFVAVPIFFATGGGYHWALPIGERYQITLIDLGGGDTVAVVVDSADDAQLEDLVAEAAPIIDSFEFPDR